MVVNNNMLNYMAAALASETYDVPGALAVGTESIIPSASDTTLSGEIGDKIRFSNPARTNNEVEFNAVRTASDVIASTGDNIQSVAAFVDTTGSDLQTAVSIPGIIHTTSFELDITFTYAFEEK